MATTQGSVTVVVVTRVVRFSTSESRQIAAVDSGELSAQLIKRRTWTPLPLTYRLGLPLMYSEVPNNDPDGKFFPREQHNRGISPLNLDTDPSSKHFGCPVKMVDSDVLLRRADGKSLDTVHYQAVEAFIYKYLMAVAVFPMVKEDVESSDQGAEGVQALAEVKKRSVAALEYAIPRSFHGFWEEYVAMRKQAQPEVYEGLHNPVVLGCYACGVEIEDMQKCGKCKAAQYCGKDCQKKDWAAHKGFCIA